MTAVTPLRAVIALLPILLLPAGAHAASGGKPSAPVAAPGAAQPAKKTVQHGKASSASRAGTTRPALAPEDDQSYLFATNPRSGKGPPDYVTSGSKHSNEPWFLTIYDTVGDWR